MEPGFVHDLFSAFYPLAVASPVMRGFELERYGLRWCHAPLVAAHVFEDGRAVGLSRNVDETAEEVERFGAGDGAAWKDLVARWNRVSDDLLGSLLGPYPPVKATVRLGARLRTPRALLELARVAVLPVRRFAEEQFRGDGAAALLGGNTLHTDLGPDSALGAFYGWMMAMLAQTVGFPCPEGGASSLPAALIRRLETRGGRVECGRSVDRIVIRGGRSVGVRTTDGTEIGAARAVLADVGAPRLFLDLVGAEHLPSTFISDLRRFDVDNATVKVDWALRSPIPWSDPVARRAGTVHSGGAMDHLTDFAADLAARRTPARPFLVIGQMTTTDPSRSPAGTETAWAYTHVPQGGVWDGDAGEIAADRIEAEIEKRAPGFRDCVIGRHVFTPSTLEAENPNLVGGAINGGTAQLHQQLVFRPVLGTGRPTTPVRGLFLASASAHPGGGVHGSCGANAARAAIAHDRVRGIVRFARRSPG
jgi:phytoene dehydrogenase-like protein